MKNDSALTKRDIWLALGLAVAAIGTRAYGLGQWDFLVDEYATINYASERMTSFNAPAYYAIVYMLFEFFGETELSARVPAMLFGAVSVPIFYLTWKNAIGRYGAAIGAVLILISSWHLWFSQFSRFYSAIFLFGSLSFYFYWKAIVKDDIRQFVFALLATIIGISFHFTMIMVPAACGLFSVIVLLIHKRLGSSFSLRIAKISSVIYVVAGLAMIPVLWERLGDWSNLGQQWGYGPTTLLLQIVKYIQVPISVAAFFGLMQFAKKDLGTGLFIFTAIATPLCTLLVLSSIVSTRPDYLFFAYPLVFVAVGFLCTQILSAIERGNFVPHVLAIILITSSMPEFVSHYTGHSSLDIRDAIAYIDEKILPDDRILPFVGGYDHYSERRQQIVRRLGGASDRTITWLPLLDEHTKRPGRLWIIVPASREQLNSSFQRWLGDNASLVWRKYQIRYDYTFKGYEIYLVV